MKNRIAGKGVARAPARVGVLFAVAAAALAFSVQQALAISECSGFGKPTYVAERTTVVDGATTRSKVYVMGDNEREEIDHNGQTEVIITTRAEFISFSPAQKIGVRRSLSGGGPKTPPGSIRSRAEDAGGNKRIVLEGLDKDGAWVSLNEVVCTPQGMLVSRKFRIPTNGGMLEASVTQNVISIGDVDKSLFVPPTYIKFGK